MEIMAAMRMVVVMTTIAVRTGVAGSPRLGWTGNLFLIFELTFCGVHEKCGVTVSKGIAMYNIGEVFYEGNKV